MTENDPKNCDRAPSASPCRLESSQHEVPNASKLPEVLKEVFEEATVAGIAWATNGTWRVLKIDNATLVVSPPRRVLTFPECTRHACGRSSPTTSPPIGSHTSSVG